MTLQELLEKEPFTHLQIRVIDDADGEVLTNNYGFYDPDYDEDDDTLNACEVADYIQKDYVLNVYVYTC